MSNLIEVFGRRDSMSYLIRNVLPVPAWATSIGAGALDFYTVPATRKALWLAHTYMNSTGGAGNYKQQIKRVDGSYRIIQPVGSVLANGGGATANPIIISAGEKASFDLPFAGINGSGRILEYDDDLTTFRVDADLVAGDNLLYTVPAGKVAVIISTSFSLVQTAVVLFVASNVSGSTRIFTPHALPVGVSASSAITRIGAVTTIATNNFATMQLQRHIFDAGEKIVVNADGTGGWAYANIVLLDR